MPAAASAWEALSFLAMRGSIASCSESSISAGGPWGRALADTALMMPGPHTLQSLGFSTNPTPHMHQGCAIEQTLLPIFHAGIVDHEVHSRVAIITATPHMLQQRGSAEGAEQRAAAAQKPHRKIRPGWRGCPPTEALMSVQAS